MPEASMQETSEPAPEGPLVSVGMPVFNGESYLE